MKKLWYFLVWNYSNICKSISEFVTKVNDHIHKRIQKDFRRQPLSAFFFYSCVILPLFLLVPAVLLAMIVDTLHRGGGSIVFFATAGICFVYCAISFFVGLYRKFCDEQKQLVERLTE